MTSGTTLVNGTLDNTGGIVTVASGATLGGSGTIDRAVSVASGGTVVPGTSPGILTTSDADFSANASFNVEVNGLATAGTDYDQLNVTGTVTIDPDAVLNLSGTVSGATGGEVLIIINNDGSDLVNGTFFNLPDGSPVTINGEDFRIFYNSGDGNDVALVSTATSILTVYVNNDFASLSDGTVLQDADPNTAGDQMAVVGITAFSTIQAGVDAVQDDPASVVNITDDINGPNASPHASIANDGAGTYAENLVVNKSVSIIATEQDPSAVIVDGSQTGSVFTIAADNTVTLDSMTIQNGSATNGGGIDSAGTLTIDNALVQNNTAAAVGGGVHSSGPALTIQGGTIITGNSAALEGGGLWTSSGTATIDDATIDTNTASGDSADQGGGGIFNAGGTLTIGGTTAVTITGNVADGASGSGGGILNDAGGTLSVTSSSITQNTANRAGGGIEDNSGSGIGVTLTSVTLDSNVATGSGNGPGSGGGLHVSNGGDVNISGGTISGNTAAADGGGIWNGTGSLTIDGGTLINNDTASGTGGGGIFNDGGTLTTSSTVRISTNSADGIDGAGGGIYNNTDGTLTLNATTISGNTANSVGGGIEDNSGTGGTVSLDTVTIQNNDASGSGNGPGNGGGLHVTGAGDVTITDGSVLNNSAALQGGGIWMGTGTLTIDGTTINNNTASGASSSDGGGGIFNDGGTLVIGDTTAATISGNVAGGAGGAGGRGIFNNTAGTVTVSNSSITGNTASAGGGIEDASDQSGVTGVTLTGVALNNNVAGGGDGTGNGGGLHVTGAGDISITGGTVNTNSAAAEGGGLWNNTGTLTIDGTTLDANTASGTASTDGGGAVFNNGGTLNVTGATLSNNFADQGSGSGGGIFNLTGGTVTLDTSTITTNHADGDGAGLLNSGTATITNSTIDFNSAAGQGGGISNSGTLDLTNVTVSGNTVALDGGGIFTGTGDATLQNTTVAFNRTDASGGGLGTGGGVHHDSTGTVTLTSTLIVTNFVGTDLTADDVNGDVTGTFNLIGIDAGLTGLTDGVDNNKVGTTGNQIDPNLGELNNNGGPTRTQAILPISPAINAGTNPQSLTTDQRGGSFVRSFGGGTDIGAYELQSQAGDGNDILVTAPTSDISSTVQVVNAITNQLPAQLSIDPYDGATFAGGVQVAVGDVNNDGTPDIITGPGQGGGPRIKVFDGTDGSVLMDFFAFDTSFTGGVYVAAADLDGDGNADIIVGAGEGGGPNVRVFSGADGQTMFDFFAYDMSFTGGVRVAAGDITGDGTPDIITGAGEGGGPNVRVFDGATPQTGGVAGTDISSGSNGNPLGNFFAFDANFTGGVYVAAGDVTGDGQIDIIAGAGPGGGPNVRVFDGATANPLPQPLGNFFAYDPSFAGGVRVAASDITGDGLADIITTPGPGGSPNLRAFDATSEGKVLPILIRDALEGDTSNTGGLSVAATVNLQSSGSPLRLADGYAPTADAGPLNISDVQPVFNAALSRLESAGVSPDAIASLKGLQLRVADLAGDRLGAALPGAIVLDVNAAGVGWYVDPTPFADQEFAGQDSECRRSQRSRPCGSD